MKHYYFVEEISGEEFLVGAESGADAWAIAEDVAYDIGIQWNEGAYSLAAYGTMSEWEAENSGLDEY